MIFKNLFLSLCLRGIIWCGIDSGDVDVRSTPKQNPAIRSLWSLWITIYCCPHWTSLNPTPLDLNSQSGPYDLSYMATPFKSAGLSIFVASEPLGHLLHNFTCLDTNDQFPSRFRGGWTDPSNKNMTRPGSKKFGPDPSLVCYIVLGSF